MSGHNKWSKIARKKGVNDQKRGKIFSKIIKEITVSAKMGGPDPEGNTRLRSAIQLAKSNNMPKDIMERAIKKGSSSDSDGVNFEDIMYEAYGPGGTAILIKCLTDNKTRTVAEIRHILTKYGGQLGATGSVAFLFHKKGIIDIRQTDANEETLMDIAIEAGAEDVHDDDPESFEVVTTPDCFEAVKTAIEKAGIPIQSAEITMVPQTNVTLDKEKAETTMKVLELLEDNDEVQNVYSNFDCEE